MKRLLLLRHAQALSGADDAARPLSLRGCEDAARLGHLLAEKGPVPDSVFCSTALRARQTADLVLEGLRTQVRYCANLYLADEETLSDFLYDGGQSTTLMIVGHNPALAQFARGLIRNVPLGPDAAKCLSLYDHYPTGTLTDITFDGSDWEDVRAGTGRLVQFLRPADLGPPDENAFS